MEEKVAELVIITEGWATRDFKKLSDLDGVIASLSHGATSFCASISMALKCVMISKVFSIGIFIVVSDEVVKD